MDINQNNENYQASVKQITMEFLKFVMYKFLNPTDDIKKHIDENGCRIILFYLTRLVSRKDVSDNLEDRFFRNIYEIILNWYINLRDSKNEYDDLTKLINEQWKYEYRKTFDVDLFKLYISCVSDTDHIDHIIKTYTQLI